MIKLFVCDIDNTLLNQTVGMPQANLQAILDLQKTGVTVALASGRVSSGMLEVAQKLKLKEYGGYVIAANGAYVCSMKEDKILLNATIPLMELKQMADFAQELGIHVSIQQGSILTYTHEDDAVRYNKGVIKLTMEAHDPLSEALYESSNKVELTHWIEASGEPFDVFTQRFQDRYSLIRGRKTFLDVMPIGVTKATGMAVVMKELGLKANEVAAIGDGENDRAMLKAAGLSATLANAKASIQAEVDHVVASVEHAGLSHFAHLVLSKNAN